jgi:hypothetical protein
MAARNGPRLAVGGKKWPHPDLIKDFVACWNAGMIMERLVARFGYSKATIQGRVYDLRAQGHTLRERNSDGVFLEDRQREIAARPIPDPANHGKYHWQRGKVIPPRHPWKD